MPTHTVIYYPRAAGKRAIMQLLQQLALNITGNEASAIDLANRVVASVGRELFFHQPSEVFITWAQAKLEAEREKL